MRQTKFYTIVGNLQIRSHDHVQYKGVYTSILKLASRNDDFRVVSLLDVLWVDTLEPLYFECQVFKSLRDSGRRRG